MEAYKSTCPDCKAIYFWQGFKTGIGKTPSQLQKMHDDDHICKKCGSNNLQTTLDDETEVGKTYSESSNFLAQMIVDAVNQSYLNGKQNG